MSSSTEAVPRLTRVLGLWDLVFYGIVLIQPIAAVGLFGVAQQLSRGQMVTTVLIAMCAMMLTAVSYGRMASVYPSAGSAYTYVSRGLNAHIGFLAGWAMVLDYLIVPIVSMIYAALTLTRLVPGVPYAAWVVLLTLLITGLNLAGIRSAAKSNIVLLFVMCLVIGWFFVMAVRYLALHGGAHALFSLQPVYDPAEFNLHAVFTATSFAALTYIGFDGVTTLAEDVKNPRRNVLIATVLVCLLTGLMSSLQIYLAARVWPAYNNFPNVETAFLDVCGRAGGPWLFQGMAVTLLVACIGTTLTGQLGAARLLYGMGRDGVLPRSAFGRLNPHGTPVFNMLLIGGITLAGSLLMNYEHAAEVLNFGAFIAFMGVNLAALRTFYRRGSFASLWRDLAAPIAGFLFCAVIWVSLPRLAKEIGATWLIVGLIYLATLTRGFNRAPAQLHFSE
ncbi:MAG TPA: APC family permease [Acidobacteriaceae bacterium]|nr:APC family permease [Acidobacteriaceae bacterium]